jgi:hypothetical protein
LPRGGEFTSVQRMKDTPEADKVPPADREKIMHIALPIRIFNGLSKGVHVRGQVRHPACRHPAAGRRRQVPAVVEYMAGLANALRAAAQGAGRAAAPGGMRLERARIDSAF